MVKRLLGLFKLVLFLVRLLAQFACPWVQELQDNVKAVKQLPLGARAVRQLPLSARVAPKCKNCKTVAPKCKNCKTVAPRCKSCKTVTPRYVTIQVENSGIQHRWKTAVEFSGLGVMWYSAKFCHTIIGSLITSALAAFVDIYIHPSHCLSFFFLFFSLALDPCL